MVMGFLEIYGSDSVPMVCERFLEQNHSLSSASILRRRAWSRGVFLVRSIYAMSGSITCTQDFSRCCKISLAPSDSGAFRRMKDMLEAIKSAICNPGVARES